ncbi:MAG: hypothetical protein KC503_35760 [Myxococcales bacterium]|nr:hypothetical protein [Myxococcales bacterium]
MTRRTATLLAAAALAALVVLGCGSEPELTLDLFSTDDYCTEDQPNIDQTRSVQLAIIGNADFSATAPLGCLAKRACFVYGRDWVEAKDLAGLVAGLRVTGATLQANVADNLAVVVTGFRNESCQPNLDEVTLCGQAFVDSFPDGGATVTLLTACAPGTASALFCNRAQSLSTCP